MPADLAWARTLRSPGRKGAVQVRPDGRKPSDPPALHLPSALVRRAGYCAASFSLPMPACLSESQLSVQAVLIGWLMSILRLDWPNLRFGTRILGQDT